MVDWALKVNYISLVFVGLFFAVLVNGSERVVDWALKIHYLSLIFFFFAVLVNGSERVVDWALKINYLSSDWTFPVLLVGGLLASRLKNSPSHEKKGMGEH